MENPFQPLNASIKKPVVLSLDFTTQVNHEDRPLDAGYLDGIIGKAAEHDVTTILWRTLAGPRGLYRSKSVPTFADQNPHFAAMLEDYDPLEAAVTSAKRHGVQLMAWATLQDFHIVRPHAHNTSPFYDERPDLCWAGLDEGSFWPGIPCYAYPEARDYYVKHIMEVMTYGVDGLYVCFRSHAGEPQENDLFGFNQPWLDQLRDETGMDATPQSIHDDPWLSYKLQTIRGASFNVLFSEIKAVANGVPLWVGVAEEPDILIAGHCEKEIPRRTLHRARLDVSRWCSEDMVDVVIVVTSRFNPCNPEPTRIYRDPTARYSKDLYAWLNLISLFPDDPRTLTKRTPTAAELTRIVQNAREADIDGMILHEIADLGFSYCRKMVDGVKDVTNKPHPDSGELWKILARP